MQQKLTVVVPVVNDDDALAGLLPLLHAWRLPIVVVDGADAASTVAVVGEDALYLAAQPSRGGQIALALKNIVTPWVWVLHADTRPSEEALTFVQSLSEQEIQGWGRFDVVLPGLRGISFFMNWRSRWSKICTGDQAMFFHTQLLVEAGGFPRQPLMEDIEISKRLKRCAGSAFHAPHIFVEASPRRWRSRGVLRTVFSMWSFRLRYFFGAKPETLVRQYYRPQY